jgi:hypothetical protein
MIVLIPSYKRAEILHWVIRSVVNCDTQGIDERILILVVNNYYPNKAIVDSTIAQFCFERNFECRAIHREKTLLAVESWFSAMFSIAQEDEVVVLLGDDDIVLPWGLKKRYHHIIQQRADMLLSDFESRIYFFKGGEKCWYVSDKSRLPADEVIPQDWDFFPAPHPEPSFMSNHCYRNTPYFRKGLELAFSWCATQHWINPEFRTGILPYYLPYCIKTSGGKVVSLQERCVLRGAVAEEMFYQDYSDGGNSAFYALCCYNTFVNRKLHFEIEAFTELQDFFRNQFLKGFPTIFLNKKISLKCLIKTISESDLTGWDLLDRRVIRGIPSILGQIPGLKGIRLRKRKASSEDLVSTGHFLKNLNSFLKYHPSG